MPKAKKKSLLFLIPSVFEKRNILFKIALVSIRLGFASTVMNGNMDATPSRSNSAINNNIIKSSKARLRSLGVSKNSKLLKVFINFYYSLDKF
jgi:hypothetical protein